MSKRFHINSKGEPGKCSAYKDRCPYGGESDHYDSPEAAYEAIAREAGNENLVTLRKSDTLSAEEYLTAGDTSDDYSTALGVALEKASQEEEAKRKLLAELKASKNVKLKKGDREKIAANSTNPTELMAVAESMNNGFFNRKIARALAQNPATPAEVLLEARSRSADDYHEFVELELHDNYPRSHMTAPGACKFIDEKSPTEIKAVLESNELNDEFADQFSMNPRNNELPGALEKAYANPHNKLTGKHMGQRLLYDSSLIPAAAKSGKWPTPADIKGKNYYYQHNIGMAPLQDDTLIAAASHTPNEESQRALWEKYKNSNSLQGVSLGLVANPKLSKELKQEVSSHFKNVVKTFNELLDEE